MTILCVPIKICRCNVSSIWNLSDWCWWPGKINFRMKSCSRYAVYSSRTSIHSILNCFTITYWRTWNERLYECRYTVVRKSIGIRKIIFLFFSVVPCTVETRFNRTERGTYCNFAWKWKISNDNGKRTECASVKQKWLHVGIFSSAAGNTIQPPQNIERWKGSQWRRKGLYGLNLFVLFFSFKAFSQIQKVYFSVV